MSRHAVARIRLVEQVRKVVRDANVLGIGRPVILDRQLVGDVSSGDHAGVERLDHADIRLGHHFVSAVAVFETLPGSAVSLVTVAVLYPRIRIQSGVLGCTTALIRTTRSPPPARCRGPRPRTPAAWRIRWCRPHRCRGCSTPDPGSACRLARMLRQRVRHADELGVGGTVVRNGQVVGERTFRIRFRACGHRVRAVRLGDPELGPGVDGVRCERPVAGDDRVIRGGAHAARTSEAYRQAGCAGRSPSERSPGCRRVLAG